MGRDHLYQPARAGRGLASASLDPQLRSTRQYPSKRQDLCTASCNVSPEKKQEGITHVLKPCSSLEMSR